MSVTLYDGDSGSGDDHLGTTVTDWSGNWSFSVNNNDGWFQNGRDIYYTFHLGNTRWHVRDSGGNDYVWQSAIHNNLDDGTVLDFGTETGSTDEESMQIFAMINRGWNHIVGAGVPSTCIRVNNANHAFLQAHRIFQYEFVLR